MEAVHAQIKKEIGEFESFVPWRGGDISKGFRITNTKGQNFFFKLNKRDLLDMFEAEAKGLELLRDNSSFRIPKILDVFETDKHSGILMEWIEPSNPDEKSWELFWKYLGELHSAKGEHFGLGFNNFIGSLKQQNGMGDSWIEFWIEYRISPLVSLALDRGQIKQDEVMHFFRLFDAARLRLGTHPFEPRLIHGDLWNGNLLFDENGAPTLIDPATYFGWPEMELAFMDLFGGFSKEGVKAYQPQGHERYLGDNYYGLWQIYPLLVHTNIFGGHYKRRLMTAVTHAIEVL